MSTIPLPALSVKPVEQPDILGNYQRLAQLRNMQQNTQMAAQEAPYRQQILQQQAQTGQIGLEQDQQAQKDQQAFRTAMQDPSMQGRTLGDVADALAHQGAISQGAWQAAKKADIDQRKSLLDLNATQFDNATKALNANKQLFESVMSLPDEQVAQNWPQIVQQYNSIPGNDKRPLNPQQPLTKDQIAQQGPMLALHQTYIDDALARRGKAADVAKAEGATDPKSTLYAPSAASVAMGTAPGAAQIQAGEVKQAADKARAEAAAKQPFEMALARQRQALSQGDPQAAGKLLVDGDATLSELKARGATPDFIQRTLEAAKQISGGKFNSQQADAAFSVAKSPTNVAFFGSSKSLTDRGGTLDQLAAAGKDLPGGMFPALNTVADWERAATGNGPIAKYASIALGVADDYAKVVGGGVGSDTARLQALNLIPKNASPQARDGAIEGIRGTIHSQMNSRIGKNPVLQRMYGEGDSQGSGAQSSAVQSFKVTATGPNGHKIGSNDGGTTWVDVQTGQKVQ